MKVANISMQDNKLSLSGELDFVNVMVVYNKSLGLLANCRDTVMVDLSPLENANSAVIALIIEWKRYAERHNMKITFQGVSLELTNIAKASNLEALFDL